MNFGIIGYGNIARSFSKALEYTTNGKIVAIGSKSLYGNDEFHKENPEINVYQTYQEVLNDPNIDGVYVALPHSLHKEWALKALNSKIPVFCEKPATLFLDDIQEIVAASKENNVLFLEAFKTKFNKGIDQLKEDLALIGKVKTISTNFCFDATGAKKSRSYLFEVGQGGALNDVGTYVIGFILDLVDSPIKKIESELKIVDQVDEQFEGTIYFENGTEGHFEGAIDRNIDRIAIIKGEKGDIIVPTYSRIEEYEVILNDGEKIKRSYPIEGTDMTMEIQSFIDLVESGQSESARHSLADTEQIISTLEKIRAGKVK